MVIIILGLYYYQRNINVYQQNMVNYALTVFACITDPSAMYLGQYMYSTPLLYDVYMTYKHSNKQSNTSIRTVLSQLHTTQGKLYV